MKTIFLEIRDRLTFVPALAIQMLPDNEAQRYYLGRCGFNGHADQIVLMKVNDQEAHSDPYDWRGCRTMGNAHLHIIKNFATLNDGDVIDVRVILGETDAPAISERIEDAAQ